MQLILLPFYFHFVKIKIPTKIICMFPTFQDFYFKRSIMQKNGIYNSTDYISLTKFISHFYNNKIFVL